MGKRLLRFLLTGNFRPYIFKKQVPKFPPKLDNIGLYLHIPFCQQICPYCPYNKVLLTGQNVAEYEKVVRNEAEMYKKYVQTSKIPSLYIGGGTPSATISTLLSLISFLKKNFNVGSEIGVEIHPNDATPENLSRLKQGGVNFVSLGIQSFQDTSLRRISRPYSGEKAKIALDNTSKAGFDVVDIDLIFAIPGETEEEIARDVDYAFHSGITQLSAYPLIIFTFTKMSQILGQRGLSKPSLWQEWKMLKLVDQVAGSYGYDRTSIWTWTKKSFPQYTSVTRQRFLGLGAGASSRFGEDFYVNTFSVEEYIKAIRQNKFPIALSTTLDLEDQKGWWLFWSLYNMNVNKDNFKDLFKEDLNGKLGLWLEISKWLGLLKEGRQGYTLTGAGAFLFNRIEQSYSLDFLNKMWGILAADPWPEKLALG